MKPIIMRMRMLCIVLLSITFNSCSEENPAEAVMNVGIAGQIQNSFLQATILHVELLFDGKVIYSQNSQIPSALVSLSGGVTGVNKGQHTISFKIVNQTTSPNMYEVPIVRVEANNTGQNLTAEKQTLATGESISILVDL